MKNVTHIRQNGVLAKAEKAGPQVQRPRVGTDDGISDRTLTGLIMVFMMMMVGIAMASGNNERGSVSDESVLEYAVLDVDNGRYEAAERKLRALAERHPESPYVSYLLGICTMQREQSLGEAIGHLSKCVSRIEDRTEPTLDEAAGVPVKALYLLGSALEQVGQVTAASAAYGRYLDAVARSEVTRLSERVTRMIQRKMALLTDMSQTEAHPLVLNIH